MSEITVTTLGDVLAHAAQRLEASGLHAPRREARQLLAAVLEMDPGALWLCLADAVQPEFLARYEQVIEARADAMPAAYAVGSQGFRTLVVRTDPRALIPRPETEGLVDHVLEWSRRRWSNDRWGTVADVGTGTGCIALALAVEGSYERVIGVESSTEAAALAKENVARLSPDTAVEIRVGNLLEPLDGPVDILVSNPPYLTADEFAELDPSVAAFEPREALVSGPTGMETTERLLRSGRDAVLPGGYVALEVDCRRASRVAGLALTLGWQDVRVAEDLAGRHRYVTAQREV